MRRTRFGFGPRLGRRPPSPHGMDPHDMGAEEHARRNGRGSAPVALGRRPVADRDLQERFSRRTAQDRPVERGAVSARRARAAYECSARLANPSPGSRIIDSRDRRPRQLPAPSQAAAPPRSRRSTLVIGMAIHVVGAPAVVHQHHRGARLGPRRRRGRGRTRRPLMSLTIAAPRATASRATIAL